jgi:hypothetical protein
MATERNKKPKDVMALTIFEEKASLKLSAKKMLVIAKKQEAKKLKQGFVYVVSEDGKTRVLTKIKKQ